ncbi:MAG: hypothetical protein PHU85_08810 [Phycisphaerae bacterium]|nr:hypothetical protein [Phycisphaerae bacterium]
MSSGIKVSVPIGKIERKMRRDHLDVLQNIEFAICREYRRNERVDDAAVREALVAMINFRDPTDPVAEAVWICLKAFRRERSDVTDEVWRDGLRVVLHSVKNHSEFRPRETSYLDFVLPFVP